MSLQNTDRLTVRLTQMRWEADAVVSYEFRPLEQADLPPFSPGAHIDLFLPNGMTRSYSLLNDPDERHRYLIAVQREADGRGGSAWMHQTPRIGDSFEISSPSNDFPLCEEASESVFFCGGIGITPIMAMIRRLNRLGRPWRLYYAARSPERAAFVHELRGVDGATRAIDFRFESAAAARLDLHGLIDATSQDAHLYCCGPRGMVDDFLSACAKRAPERVHYERFAAAAESATAGGFDVVLNRSGRRIAIATGKSILDALLDNGVSVQYACSAGVCGTCKTRVIDGVPDHRDDYLTDDEKCSNDAVMVCCSGSLSSTLVLDL
jgi:vanillate O-demethylase ferredoxin subunit